MCGIIAGFNTKGEAVNEEIVNQYEDQHSRGTEGFGILGWAKTGKISLKRACEPAKFMFDLHAKNFPMMVVHHRHPTSTGNWLNQTHPILVSHESLEHDYYVIHNGVISNKEELHKTHQELGFEYTTLYEEEDYYKKIETKFNDTEAFAVEIVRYIEGFITEINVRGSFAFIAVAVDKEKQKPLNVFFGRNTNPLKMAKKQNYLFLSSEGKGHDIEKEMLYEFKPSGEMELSSRPLHIKAVPQVTQQSTVGYKTEYKTHKKEEQEDKKNSFFSYSNSELEFYEDEANNIIQAFLEECDSPDTCWFARLDKTIKDLGESLADAQEAMIEKYAVEVPNNERDTENKAIGNAELFATNSQ